eukprot:SAG31_NODE_9813_length_1224_cov_0.820444_1_plen_128_part_10
MARGAQEAGAVAVLFINPKFETRFALPIDAKDDGSDSAQCIDYSCSFKSCTEAYICLFVWLHGAVQIPSVCVEAGAAVVCGSLSDAGTAVSIHLAAAVGGDFGSNYARHPLYSMYKDCGRICGMALFH